MPVSSLSVKPFKHVRATLLAVSAVIFLSACSWMPFIGSKDSEDNIEEIETTEEKVYSEAQRSLRSSNHRAAIEQLELLEARFPFGRFAEQAKLELIYARYMSYDLEGALSGADRFIRLHPSHDDIDYAYYMRALSAYRNSNNILDAVFGQDPARRDMRPLKEAYQYFSELLEKYPASKYSPDARQRMLNLREVLARSEIAVADFYLRRGANVAAANRGRFILENYPDTEARAEALAVIIEASWKLNLKEEADNALQVLKLNHPDFESFDENGNLVLAEKIRNRDRSWTNIMTLGILDRPKAPPPIKLIAGE